jgi:transposase InsO family protein
MTHANAILTPTGRLKLARLVVEKKWTLARAAERFSISITTAKRWADRYREDPDAGQAGMLDRSSRPGRSPGQLPQRVERRILGVRVARRWGPARIAYHLGLNPSTVHKVLQRYRCPRLKWTDPATGTRIKTSKADKNSYVHPACGDLVHVDIKKLGRIPDGGGWRFRGLQAGRHNKHKSKAGYAYLHHAVDDHSRLAYSEIHCDERKETAVAFWKRAVKFFAAHGITIKRVLTDNGSCYRSRLWAKALGKKVKHKRTRPYRPQTNGKVERFNRTLLEGWAYRRLYASEAARRAAFAPWLHWYNHHRPHSALGGHPPITRCTNLPKPYS